MENQEKKEYVAPQMSVVEYECQGTLLECSQGCTEVEDDY